MSVTVKPILPTKSNLEKYVQFGIDLYKGNDYFVPPLIIDEVATLSPDSNPAFEHCSAQSFMAFRDGQPVGRITAIINDLVNSKQGNKAMRFGFVDFIDDAEVVDVLFKAACDWGRNRGCTSVIGPMGFSDMDHEGMLIDGFKEMGTMATIYNHDYYPRHMERMGFEKDVDWVEFRMTVPDKVPDKYVRIADIVRKKFNLRTIKFTSRKKIKEQYGRALFELINEAYATSTAIRPCRASRLTTTSTSISASCVWRTSAWSSMPMTSLWPSASPCPRSRMPCASRAARCSPSAGIICGRLSAAMSTSSTCCWWP